jgi:hypothetical protein
MPRFWQPPEWRHVVTNRESETLTFLDRLAFGVRVDYDLNTPSQLGGRVPADNPEVNIAAPAPDGDPFLSEGTRLCYSFRKDDSGAGGTKPFGIRHSGILLGMTDVGDPDVAYSDFLVLDPWAYLYMRPCVDEDGDLPGEEGLNFFATPVAEIALALLKHTIDAHGPVGIDADTAWGGTSFYDGFQASGTEEIDYHVQRSKTVGEAWDDLCATDLLDLELVPIYDPVNRPGYTHELNTYRQPGLITQPRGEEQPQAIFSWDKPPRTLSSITRGLDGKQRANMIAFYNREGVPAGLKPDTPSVAKYGEYWLEQFFPDQTDEDRVGDWAEAQLALRSRGRRDVTPLPSPQQPPLLWEEFFIGDRVPVYASSRLRQPIPTADPSDGDGPYHRVLGLTLSLDPQERLTELRVSPEAVVSLT